MKQRLSIIIIALLLAVQAGYCRGFDSVFNEFKKKEDVTYISMPPFVTWLGKNLGGVNDVPMADKVKSMKMLVSESRCESLINRINDTDSGCEELLRMNDDGDVVKIWMDSKGDKIKRLYLLNYSDSECTFMELKGDFKKSDILKFVNESNNK